MVQGHVLAYDQVTGFGLVQALARLDIPVLLIGRSESCSARVAEEQGGFSSASEFRSGATRKEGVASKRGAKNRRRSEIAVAPVGSLRDMTVTSGDVDFPGHRHLETTLMKTVEQRLIDVDGVWIQLIIVTRVDLSGSMNFAQTKKENWNVRPPLVEQCRV